MTARPTKTGPALLAGFVAVYGVLAIGTGLDASARFGLLTLVAVVVAAVLTERFQTRSGGAVIRGRLDRDR